MGDNTAIDTYKSISSTATGSYRELGSRFLSFAWPVSSETEVREIVANVKKEYFDARHHCYAYRLGPEGEAWRANDDGEPSSTAGKPILGQLLSREISDVLTVVVRYFGGTKLGVPGLIRAYRAAASDALDKCEIITKVCTVPVIVTFPYPGTDQILRLAREYGAVIMEQNYDNLCRLKLELKRGLAKDFTRDAREAGAEITI